MVAGNVQRFLHEAWEVALETLWPTRCAVCDLPGERVLCERCESALVPVDVCRACPRCGAPFGQVQCTECNAVMLAAAGMERFPIDRMAHALVFDDAARRIVSVYKDSDERRLRAMIAERMARLVSLEERSEGYAIAYIPDSRKAYRRRGFDHGHEIAHELAELCDLECIDAFERPRSADQRKLGRHDRIQNMQGRLRVREGLRVPGKVIVVDDVCTTGATIYAACAALRDAGATSIHAITFAQVMD